MRYRHPRWRAGVCLGFGLAAVAPIALFAAVAPIYVFFPLLWTGVPALLLLGSAKHLLTSA